jgi:hypothetical protein
MKARCGRRTLTVVDGIRHVPYILEQDEDGIWCASARLRPAAGVVGDGLTAEAAVADLCEALIALAQEVGLTSVSDVA